MVHPTNPSTTWLISDDYGALDIATTVGKLNRMQINADATGELTLRGLECSPLISFVQYTSKDNHVYGILEVGASLSLDERVALVAKSPKGTSSLFLERLFKVYMRTYMSGKILYSTSHLTGNNSDHKDAQ
jgi:hypothetical protein